MISDVSFIFLSGFSYVRDKTSVLCNYLVLANKQWRHQSGSHAASGDWQMSLTMATPRWLISAPLFSWISVAKKKKKKKTDKISVCWGNHSSHLRVFLKSLSTEDKSDFSRPWVNRRFYQGSEQIRHPDIYCTKDDKHSWNENTRNFVQELPFCLATSCFFFNKKIHWAIMEDCVENDKVCYPTNLPLCI